MARGLCLELELSRWVTVVSPKSGFVIHKTALEGIFVKRGAQLYTVADLDALWAQADVFEFDAPWVVAGQRATVELNYLPGQVQEAEVQSSIERHAAAPRALDWKIPEKLDIQGMNHPPCLSKEAFQMKRKIARERRLRQLRKREKQIQKHPARYPCSTLDNLLK